MKCTKKLFETEERKGGKVKKRPRDRENGLGRRRKKRREKNGKRRNDKKS